VSADPNVHEERPAVRAVSYREASEGDAEAIAVLHADSWRRHYRGTYLDSYLDGDVVADRLSVWRGRLAPPRLNQYTAVAVGDGETVGFAHVVYDADERWGALLDNLHVTSNLKGNGIGTRLLSEVARALLEDRPTSALHLWVLDQNTAAQSFYDARGGTRVQTELRGPFPGGGHALGHRYFWADPTVLVGTS
jgi:ribosomal protein S18 acetylase RimI-like enzyme